MWYFLKFSLFHSVEEIVLFLDTRRSMPKRLPEVCMPYELVKLSHSWLVWYKTLLAITCTNAPPFSLLPCSTLSESLVNGKLSQPKVHSRRALTFGADICENYANIWAWDSRSPLAGGGGGVLGYSVPNSAVWQNGVATFVIKSVIVLVISH